MAAQVRGNLLLAALDERAREAVAEQGERVVFVQGDSLYQDGDELRHVWFVEQGLISLVTTLSDGFTVENTAVGREGAVGLTADLRSTRAFGAAVAQTHGEAVRLDLGRVRELAEEQTGFRRRLGLFVDQVTAHSRQSAACLARHDVLQRLCRWLLRCHDRMGDQGLPLTQEFLGHMLGTRRSTVSMVAGTLESAGLIRYSRGFITVQDRRGLEARTCECYASLRRRSVELGLEPPHTPF
jgi:CRP-like cAMP-binding protein